MSSFGTAVLVDVADEHAFRTVAAALDELDGDIFVPPAPAGWFRVVAYLVEPGRFDDVRGLLAGAGRARAAVAEDFDDYGALWAVLEAADGQVRTVHRRAVLNADPSDAEAVREAIEENGTDPRVADAAGPDAAAAAARLFGADAARMVEAEASSASAFEEIGIIGGPFPWWDALGLPWPQESAGPRYARPPATPASPSSGGDVDDAPRRRWWRRDR